MKKILRNTPWSIIMVLIIALLAFNSCGEDDDSSPAFPKPATSPDSTPPVELADIVVVPTRSQDTIRIGESVMYEFGADTLTNTATYAWAFDGGTPDFSTASNPTITYATAGNYGAALSVTRNADSKVFSGEMAASLVVLDTARSSFMADVRVIAEGGQVTFTNTGTATADLLWTFEGGTPATSTEAEVTVVYATPGTYAVSLASTLNGETNTNEQLDYIEVTPIVASFTATETAILEGQTVTYTSTSSDGAALSWTFEGGTPATSTEAEVVVTYATAGIYDASLTATENGVTKTAAETDFVTVTVPTPAEFVSAESSADGSTITIAYNQALNDPKDEVIQVFVNGTESPGTIALDPADPMKIVISLDTAFTSAADMITVTYAAPGITTTDGGVVAPLTDQAVVNNFTTVDATFVSAVSSDDGTTITITYSEPLVDPSGETITVMVGTTMSTVTSIAAGTTPKEIVVTLATPIGASSDMITVTYAPTIRTTTGGAVEALTNKTVVNNVSALVNLFATGDFEGITTAQYNVNTNFQGNGNRAAIVASFADGVGVDNSRALLYTVTGAVDGDSRAITGDQDSSNVQFVKPLENGATYTVKAMIKFTGVKPTAFEFGVLNFPFAGTGSLVFANLDLSGVVAGADFVEVEGTFTAKSLGDGTNTNGDDTDTYALPRLTAGAGDSVVTVDNIRVFAN